ncbi:MAG: hypothetical protein HYY84_13205 [Deltaproteobacteria bacterium]|nr:hypothetical protein [Deltaproteobacteria bacterium]
MNRFAGWLALSGGILFHLGIADAGQVQVKARLYRPVWYVTDDSGTKVRDRSMSPASEQGWTPASHQRVVVYQPGTFGPIYCGTFFTNTRGEINGDVNCGPNQPPTLYFEAEGVSELGFSVGTFDEAGFWWSAIASVGPQLLAALLTGDFVTLAASFGSGIVVVAQLMKMGPKIYRWGSPWINLTPGQSVVDFGSFQLGRGVAGAGATNDDWAAATMEGVSLAYRTLRDGIRAQFPYFSSWIINNPMFGSPSTAWTTVHMKQNVVASAGMTDAQIQDASWVQNMWNLAHELGHVQYNVRHSDENHYWGDIPNYLHNHTPCSTNLGYAFAQYEGYAEAFSSVLWGIYSNQNYSLKYKVPALNCKDANRNFGLDDEGNVADFYATIIAGRDTWRPASSLTDDYLAHFGAEWANLPPLDAMLEMVTRAGSSAHDVKSVWASFWEKECAKNVKGYPMFCGTRRFQCYVKARLARSGEVPFDLASLDCGAGASRILNAKTESATSDWSLSRVSFSEVANVDSYQLWIRPEDGSAAPFTRFAPTSQYTSFGGIGLEPCKAYYLHVKTTNEYGTTTGPEYRYVPVDDAGNCLPGLPSVTTIFTTFVQVYTGPMMTAVNYVESAGGGASQGSRDSSAGAPGQYAPEEFYVEYGAVLRANDYQVRYSTAPNDPAPQLTNWDATTRQTVWLQPCRTNYVRVAARNAFGENQGPVFEYFAFPRTGGCPASKRLTATNTAHNRLP